MCLRSHAVESVAASTCPGKVVRIQIRNKRRRFKSTCHAHGGQSVQTPVRLRIVPWVGSPSQLRSLSILKSRFHKEIADGDVDESMLKWFLRDREGDVRESEEKLRSTLIWRKSLGRQYMSKSSARREAELGKAWLHDYLDVLGRPVVIMVPAKHIIGQFPLSSTQQLCAEIAEDAILKMPDGCETILAVFDLRGFGPLNADLNLVKFLVDLFFVYYPRRLGQVLVVEAPWIFDPVWQVIKPWLRKYAGLVRFIRIQDLKTEYFNKSTLPSLFVK